jgi:hypothetical protein
MSRIVVDKFGVKEYPRAMRRLMSLRHKWGVEEYVKEFEEVRYAIMFTTLNWMIHSLLPSSLQA